jgi:hypothetical protein
MIGLPPGGPSSAGHAGNARGLARSITNAFATGAFDLAQRPGAPVPGWAGMPEVAVAGRLREAGATDADVRLFLTFTAAMDRARNADRLWNDSCRLFLEHRWAFDPEAVRNRSCVELAEILRSHRVSQRHKVDSRSWFAIAEILFNPLRGGAVRRVVYDGRGDAQELLRALQEKREDGSSPCFPLLKGPKIGPMWVRMLAYPGRATISSIEVIPVAVDVQVRRVTEYLGVTGTRGHSPEKVRAVIQEVWREDVRGHGAEGPQSLINTCAALDPALWFFGKWGCTRCKQAGRQIPISGICNECRFDGES